VRPSSSGAISTGSHRPVSTNVFDLLREQTAARPKHEAIVTSGGRRTYSEWLDGAGRVAAGLRSAGVRAGDTVALLANNSLEWLETAFGCAAIGARVAPINTWVKAPELDYLLTFSRPSAVVTLDRAGKQDFLTQFHEIVPELWDGPPGQWRSARVPSLRGVVVIGDDLPAGAIAYRAWQALEPATDPAVVPDDDVAMVLFTSGSTARPKGVAQAHRDLVTNGFEIGERQGLDPEDRLFLSAPLFWSFGAANALMSALTHGTTLVLQPQFEPSGALDLIETEGCTALYTMPVMTHALLNEPSFRPARVATLRKGLTIGAPAEIRQVAEDLGASLICNIYGSTEVYGNCCVTPHDAPLERRMAASGPPLPGVELRIVDPETGAAVGGDEVGEILVRGRVTPGYLDETGGLSPIVDPDGYFATGDLGRIDEDGWLVFIARRSEMIKTAGINVSPAEVEDVLLGHEDVAEAAVAGAAHEVRGEEVVAFVRLRPQAVIAADDLREWCRSRMASYKVPARILIVEEFPTTTTGKLARRELKALAEAASTGGSPARGDTDAR
jgi:fatty-acyl-CoA synthase